MKELQIFNNIEFGQIRTVEVEGRIYFVASDVARALGYARPADAVTQHCRYTVKHSIPHPQNIEKQIEVNVIPEGDMYRLITHSKLDSAERFESWVFDKVLPALRKTGSYEVPKKLSATEQLRLQNQAILEVDEKVEAVNQDLQQFKQDMPILGIEEDRITNAVKKKGIQCLGGKNSNAYKDHSLRQRLYRDIYRELYRQFGVSTYKAIKRSQCDIAVDIIEGYEPPLILAEQITDCNAQMNINQEVA